MPGKLRLKVNVIAKFCLLVQKVRLSHNTRNFQKLSKYTPLYSNEYHMVNRLLCHSKPAVFLSVYDDKKCKHVILEVTHST
jgi:hypothetical protein